MKRRDFFVKSTLAAGTAAITGLSNSSSAIAQTSRGNKNKAATMEAKNKFKLNYAPHFGMFENSAGKDLIDQLKFMADNGFMALEDNGLMGRPVEMQTKIGETLNKLGMTMGVFVIDKGGNSQNSLAAGKKEYIDIFLNGCKKAVETAKRVNAKWMTVVPGDFERNLPIGIQTGHVIEVLRRAAEIFEPQGLVMVLEPLSDSPDLQYGPDLGRNCLYPDRG
jgi:hydroxypyruvate isomerase